MRDNPEFAPGKLREHINTMIEPDAKKAAREAASGEPEAGKEANASAEVRRAEMLRTPSTYGVPEFADGKEALSGAPPSEPMTSEGLSKRAEEARQKTEKAKESVAPPQASAGPAPIGQQQIGAGYVVPANEGGPANVSYPASQAAGRLGPIRNELVTAVKRLEGFSEKSFGDYRQESIGYGTRARYRGEEINEAEGERRLRQELTMHANRIDTAARRARINLTEGQRDALISFDFNTGKGADLITSSGGNLNEIRRRMALYVKAGGKTLPGLVRRRREELVMFNT